MHWVTEQGEAYVPGVSFHKDGAVEHWFKYERPKVCLLYTSALPVSAHIDEIMNGPDSVYIFPYPTLNDGGRRGMQFVWSSDGENWQMCIRDRYQIGRVSLLKSIMSDVIFIK